MKKIKATRRHKEDAFALKRKKKLSPEQVSDLVTLGWATADGKLTSEGEKIAAAGEAAIEAARARKPLTLTPRQRVVKRGTAAMTPKSAPDKDVVLRTIPHSEIVKAARAALTAWYAKAVNKKGLLLWCVSYTPAEDKRAGTALMVRRLPDGATAQPYEETVDLYVRLPPDQKLAVEWAEKHKAAHKAKSYTTVVVTDPEILKLHP